jgi:hypothetical protein
VGCLVVCHASIVDYPNGAFVLLGLSDARGILIISRRTCWSLIVALFLSTIPCEVTRLSAKEACEDFPLSILLDGSSGVSSFSAPPYSLFVLVSSWEEVFRFHDPCSSSSLSRFPLALSPKTKRTRSYTSCESTHVTSGVNTRQTPSNLTGIRTTEITAWQLDALSSRDRRGSGRRGLSRRSGRVDI